MHVTASQAHGTHLLVGADDGTLVFLDGVGYIICIGVEDSREGAVGSHGDMDGVAANQSTQITQSIRINQTIGIADKVVARVGGGNDAHRAVGHDDVAAGDGVGFHILLAGDGVDAAHHAVGLEGQQVGVVQEVGLDLHVAVDVDHRGGNAAVEDEAVALGHLGPVDEVVVGVRGGGEAQVGIGKDGVVVVFNVVVHTVGQGGLAGDVEGAGRGDDGDAAFKDAVHGQVVAGGVFGDFTVAALDLHDVAGLIPFVGQLDALGLDDTGTGDGVALVAGEVDRAHGHVAHGKRKHGVGGKGGGQGVVGLDGQLDGQGVKHSQAVGRRGPVQQVVTLGGDGTDDNRAVGHHIPGAVVGSDGHAVRKGVTVVYGELVDLQVMGRRAADGELGGVHAADRTVLVVVGGGDGVTLGIGADGVHQVGTVGDVEVDLRDDGTAGNGDGDAALASLEVHTLLVGLAGGDGDVVAAHAGGLNVGEGHAVLLNHEFHVTAFVVDEGEVTVVQAEHGFGGGVARHGERQGRVSREERLRLCGEEAVVDDVVGGIGHAVLVDPVGHMVQLGGVGLDGDLGAVVDTVGDGVNLGHAGRHTAGDDAGGVEDESTIIDVIDELAFHRIAYYFIVGTVGIDIVVYSLTLVFVEDKVDILAGGVLPGTGDVAVDGLEVGRHIGG